MTSWYDIMFQLSIEVLWYLVILLRYCQIHCEFFCDIAVFRTPQCSPYHFKHASNNTVQSPDCMCHNSILKIWEITSKNIYVIVYNFHMQGWRLTCALISSHSRIFVSLSALILCTASWLCSWIFLISSLASSISLSFLSLSWKKLHHK